MPTAPGYEYQQQIVGSDGVTVWDPGSKTLVTATIASGASTSGAIALGAGTITGIVLPAAFTGTALSFQVSADGSTYVALYDSTNTLESMTVAQGRGYSVNPAVFAGWPYMKVVSGSTEAGSRDLILVTRPV
jgi:hypothetical protein